jgi:hypothetical protein
LVVLFMLLVAFANKSSFIVGIAQFTITFVMVAARAWVRRNIAEFPPRCVALTNGFEASQLACELHDIENISIAMSQVVGVYKRSVNVAIALDRIERSKDPKDQHLLLQTIQTQMQLSAWQNGDERITDMAIKIRRSIESILAFVGQNHFGWSHPISFHKKGLSSFQGDVRETSFGSFGDLKKEFKVRFWVAEHENINDPDQKPLGSVERIESFLSLSAYHHAKDPKRWNREGQFRSLQILGYCPADKQSSSTVLRAQRIISNIACTSNRMKFLRWVREFNGTISQIEAPNGFVEAYTIPQDVIKKSFMDGIGDTVLGMSYSASR